MSYDENAESAQDIIEKINAVLPKMNEQLSLILFERTVGDETLEFSENDKEACWTIYLARKAELQALVSGLP